MRWDSLSFPVQQLGKFVSLSPVERRLLAHAALLVAFVRLGLWLVPLRNLRRLLARLANPRGLTRSSQFTPERITWAVQASSRFVPQATCLTQALATQVLLQREGYPAHLRLGVALKSKLEAHAWVESRGKIVIGGPRLEHLTPLPGFDRPAICRAASRGGLQMHLDSIVPRDDARDREE